VLSQGRYRRLANGERPVAWAAGQREGQIVTEATTPEEEPVHVWIDQNLCTGDGLCVQYAREVFEFDVDGLAYVKDGSGELQTEPGARADVPAHLRLDVIDAALECPGNCIHVVRAADGVEVAGPATGAVRAG
jgi:ferredoxin